MHRHLRGQLIRPLAGLASCLVFLLLAVPYLLLSFPDHGKTWVVALGLTVVVVLGRTRLSLWLWQRAPLRELRRSWATCRFFGFWNQSLTEGGNVITTLEKAARACDDSELQQSVWSVIARLNTGKSLGQAFSEARYFSPTVRDCVLHSLDRGQMNELLQELWRSPEIRLCLRASHLVELLTPFMLFFWGLLWVGLIDMIGQLL